MKAKVNPNIYRVVIENEYVADIVAMLYQRGLFDDLWNLRKKYNLPEEPYPNTDKQVYMQFMSEGKHYGLAQDIKKLRHYYNIPPNYADAMQRIVVTGKVSSHNYMRVYYEYKYEYETNDPDEDVPGYHIIVLHPAATKTEVLKAYEDFLTMNGIQTKSGKKVGKSKSQKYKQSEPGIGEYYHRILSYIDQQPLALDLDRKYKVYQRIKLDGSYIPYVLEQVRQRSSKYRDVSLDDYHRMRKLTRRNAKASQERDVAHDFIGLFDTYYERAKADIQPVSDYIKTVDSRFTTKAV